MTHQDIEEAIYTAVRKVKPSLTDEPLSPQTRFDTYNISSLELAMITFEIEDRFDLEIAEANLDTFQNIAQARDLVVGLLQQVGDIQVVPA